MSATGAVSASALAELIRARQREARLLLAVGSALEVHPVAGLPLETIEAGGELAIVNRGATAFGGRASLRIDEKAATVLAAVADELRPRRA